MNSRERVLISLNHKEPDKIPVSLGSTHTASIVKDAYQSLCDYIGLNIKELKFYDIVQQLPYLSEEFLDYFDIDTRGIYSPKSYSWPSDPKENNDSLYFFDEWGIKWVMSKKSGLYFDARVNPLKGKDFDYIKDYKFPDPIDEDRYKTIDKQIELAKKKNKAIFSIRPIGVGLLMMAENLRGMEDFLIDMSINKKIAFLILDKLLEIYIKGWEKLLSKYGNYIDAVQEGDDLSDQTGPLMSLEMYREFLKPRLSKIIRMVKSKSNAKIIYHCDGNVRPFIPDLIDCGVDCLNPIQYSSRGMDTKELKKEFGKDISFFGGGCDTQKILPYSTPEKVKEEVKRRIDDLAPGGGFIFTTVHNIQKDVPPENIEAMFQAIQEYGKY
jgi:uroporphyrinogen decarboxylase